jgi:hypothetical protein
MPEKRIRFGVRDQARRAATWTLALRVSADRPEVYLCARGLGGVLKTSLHAYGMWRHAYVKGRFTELFEGIENAPEDRCIEEWPRPAEHGPGITWALRILVPPAGARTPIEPGLENAIHWIKVAPEPRWTEIDIFFLAASHATVGPAPNATDFAVIATEPLGNGEFVHVVHQSIEPPQFTETQQGQLRFFAGHSATDILETEYLHALAFATDSLGIHILVDSAVEVAPSARERLAAMRPA